MLCVIERRNIASNVVVTLEHMKLFMQYVFWHTWTGSHDSRAAQAVENHQLIGLKRLKQFKKEHLVGSVLLNVMKDDDFDFVLKP